jgi:hypothetical protein
MSIWENVWFLYYFVKNIWQYIINNYSIFAILPLFIMNGILIWDIIWEREATKKEIVWYVSPLSDDRIKALDISEPDWRERNDHIEHQGSWYVLLSPENSDTFAPPGAIKVLIRQRISSAISVYTARHAEIIEILEAVS